MPPPRTSGPNGVLLMGLKKPKKKEANIKMIPYPFPVSPGSPFPVSNIPFGIFHTEQNPNPRPGAAIGNHVLDLQILIQNGIHVEEPAKHAIFTSSLNALAALLSHERSSFRKAIQEAVRTPSSILYKQGGSVGVIAQEKAIMHVPMEIGGFTDFRCSLEHVQTVSRLTGHSQVPPNFFEIPLAYNGRASSVIVSGQGVTRPQGVVPGPDGPGYSPSQKFDFEVEMGVFISRPVAYGRAVHASGARNHIFGFVLLNDWSARDIQFYEMTPLGPFNGKATATSISPWVVTLEALDEAGAVIAPVASNLIGGKNTSIPFLKCSDDVAVRVSSYLSNLLGTSDLKHLHWSPFQMLAHHSSSGCGLETGDLIGTGTPSSTEEQAAEFGDKYDLVRRSGCLHELVQAGSKPFRLSGGSELRWLEDGDIVTIEGWAGSGDRVIGFGQLFTQIMPSMELPTIK
ncbi:fumarylacetoacetate hydrolase [Xylariaceae sp. FL0662B]|nr:fumarylacetoacetate hydrolase [Xylariaceae sp. FL0662B]